jgi:hypothetical protein
MFRWSQGKLSSWLGTSGRHNALVGGVVACAAGVGTALATAASDMTVVTGVVAGLVATVVAGALG